MVAYSFHAQFEEPIVSLRKRQTIRGNRRRHARTGEAIQLYTAMRTRQCRKLLAVDPICLGVTPIALIIDPDHDYLLASALLMDCPLNNVEIEQLAWEDGFGSQSAQSARRAMGEWWFGVHGAGTFEGFLIRWEPQR